MLPLTQTLYLLSCDPLMVPGLVIGGFVGLAFLLYCVKMRSLD